MENFALYHNFDIASHARQVKGVDPDKEGCSGPAGWGLGIRLTTPPHKKYVYGEASKIGNQMDSKSQDREQWRKSLEETKVCIGL